MDLLTTIKSYKSSSVAPAKNEKAEGENEPGSTARQFPPEIIDIILGYITKPYIQIESTQKLYLLMMINKTFMDRVKIILKNHYVNYSWNKDKDFIFEVKKSLKFKKYIKYLSKARQIKWCEHSIDTIMVNRNLHPNKIAYGIKRISEIVRHIKLSLTYIATAERNAILDSLSKRVDLKSLDLYIGYESNPAKQKYTEKIIKILNRNPKLVNVPFLGFVGNTFNSDKLDELMQALLNKKVGALIFENVKINYDILNRCSNYLKNLNINSLSINSASLSQESIKYILLNLPKNIKILSLEANNIDKDMAKFIFKNIDSTKLEYIYLSKNNLSGFSANDLREIAKNLSIEKIYLYNCDLYEEKHYFTEILNQHKKEIQFFFEIKRTLPLYSVGI